MARYPNVEERIRTKGTLRLILLRVALPTASAVLVIALIVIAMGYPATVPADRNISSLPSGVIQQPEEVPQPVASKEPVKRVPFGNWTSDQVVNVNSVTTEDLQTRITLVPSLLGGFSVGEATNQIEAKRNEMLNTFLNSAGAEKVEAYDEQAWFLKTAAAEGHADAHAAIQDLILGFDSSARQNLGRAGVDWIANSIRAITAFGDYVYPGWNGVDTSAYDIAQKLQNDEVAAINSEIQAEIEAQQRLQREQELSLQATAVAVAEEQRKNEESAQATAVAQQNPNPAGQGAPQDNQNPASGIQPAGEVQAEPQPATENQPALPPTRTDQNIVDELPVVPPEQFFPPSAPVTVSPQGLGFSSTPLLWMLRSMWEAINGLDQFSSPHTMYWHVLQVNSFYEFDILGMRFELVSIWLGETPDTLAEADIPSLYALRKNQMSGVDARGNHWWSITTFIQWPRNLKEGDVTSPGGIADLIRYSVETLAKK